MQDIGFVYYWWLRDYQKAAEWFDRGADQPGAPWWMRSLAANTLAQGGDRRASRALWQALAQTPDNEWLQKDARRRLHQLDALDAVDALRPIVERFIDEGGAQPYSWEALLRAGYLRAVPTDPAGVPLHLGPYTGDVQVSDTSPLQPLPSEPPPTR
jgi:TPR repeat protein